MCEYHAVPSLTLPRGSKDTGLSGSGIEVEEISDPCYANNSYHPNLTAGVCDDCGMDFD
jgi:hypothetical protein